MQWVSQVVLFILNRADYFFSGSLSGMTEAEIRENPYRDFGLLRARGHVLRTYRNRGWIVLGFDEVQAVFRDARFGADMRKNAWVVSMLRMAADGRPVSYLDSPTMLNLDPPDHTRLRKLANHGFLHKFILSLEPRIEAIATRCLDTCEPASGQFDVMNQLAKPLPVIVIAELLGLPEEDLPRFQALSEDLIGLSALGNDALMDAGAKANAELIAYFSEVIAAKRSAPGDDMISRLIAAEEDGDRLTAEELNSTCVVLLIAGHETTARLIGNGVYQLLKHPEQLALLRREPALLPNAIEEMLRFEPPLQFMVRFAQEDIEFFGRQIKKNQVVMAVIASANRDPAKIVDPERFDITRQNVDHVSFGYGIHLCLGMTLARLESRVAIQLLLDRFPEFHLAEQTLTWSSVPMVRGLDSLVINVTS